MNPYDENAPRTCNHCHGWGMLRGCLACSGTGWRTGAEITAEIVEEIFTGVDADLMARVKARVYAWPE